MREDRIIQLYTKCKSSGTNYRYDFIKYDKGYYVFKNKNNNILIVTLQEMIREIENKTGRRI